MPRKPDMYFYPIANRPVTAARFAIGTRFKLPYFPEIMVSIIDVRRVYDHRGWLVDVHYSAEGLLRNKPVYFTDIDELTILLSLQKNGERT